MKKSTFVRNGNVGFTGLTKTEEPGGRTLIICQHCGGDAVQNKEEKFICKKCGKESKLYCEVKRRRMNMAEVEEDLFNPGSIGLV